MTAGHRRGGERCGTGGRSRATEAGVQDYGSGLRGVFKFEVDESQSCDGPSRGAPPPAEKAATPPCPTEGAHPALAPEEADTFLWTGLEMSSRPRGQRGRGTVLSGRDGGQQSPGHAVSWPGLRERGLCREWRLTPCSRRDPDSVLRTQLCPAVL